MNNLLFLIFFIFNICSLFGINCEDVKTSEKLHESQVVEKIILNVGSYKFTSALREVDHFEKMVAKMQKDAQHKNQILNNFKKEVADKFYLSAKTFCKKDGFLEMVDDSQLEKIINFICSVIEDEKWLYSGNSAETISSEDLDFLKKEIELYFNFFDKRSNKNKKLKNSESYQRLLILYFCYMSKQIVSVCLRDLPTFADESRFSFLIKKMTGLVAKIIDPKKNQLASDFLKSYKRIFDRNFSNKKIS